MWLGGTSRDGFDAEWRMVCFLTHDGGLIDRGEIFEEADLDTAIARFDELHTQNLRLETRRPGSLNDSKCASKPATGTQ